MSDIISAVDKFIDSRIYHYALMINGEWGCGKTYFVQDKLIPYLSKEKKKTINYISLYGVKSTDELCQKMCLQAIKDKLGKVGQAADSKGGQVISSIISAATKIGFNKFDIEGESINDIVLKIPNYDDNVIIFDDLERCICDINEVLGFINNFVEHSEASVIIVANEEEIGNWQYDRNPELQTLIALDERADVEVEPTQGEYLNSVFNNGNKTEKNKYSLEQINQKKKKIFRSNERYLRMKEKVIGQTLYYEPDLKTIFAYIIDNNIKDQPVLQNALRSMIDDFVEIAKNERHNNIRTFQFFIEKSSVIFNAINNSYSSLHSELLRYIFKSSIRHMKGLEMPLWEGDYGTQIFDYRINSNSAMFGFKFIDEVVYKEKIDLEHIYEVLSNYSSLKEKNGQLYDDPINKIKYWYCSSDEELSTWLKQISVNIRTGKYSTILFTDLLNKTSFFCTNGIMCDLCEDIYDAMVYYITNTDPSNIDMLGLEHFPPEGKEAAELFKERYVKIDDLIKTARNESEKQAYEKAISNTDSWATNLNELEMDQSSRMKHSAFYWIQPKKFAQIIEKSSNSELYQFRVLMGSYYNGRNYIDSRTEDIENLNELKRLLENTDKSTFEDIRKYYYKTILNDISAHIDRLSARYNYIG